MTTTFSNLFVSWSNLTAITQAQSIQAQEQLQAAFSRGQAAVNSSPQAQDSEQKDQSHALADSTIKVPRAGYPDDESEGPIGPDVVVIGQKLHATNDNLSVQSQKLSQDAIMDTPSYYIDPEWVLGGYESVPAEGEEAPSLRSGASNVTQQDQSNLQEKKSLAQTRTRLIELVGHPERRRAGTIYDVADVKADTTAVTDQEQDLAQTAIVNDQDVYQTQPWGANNVGTQNVASKEDLTTYAQADIDAPLGEREDRMAVGTGTFHGSVKDIGARGEAATRQKSSARLVALDSNISGANGEAVNVLPQAQSNEQTQDTRATTRMTPRSFVERDSTATVEEIHAASTSDNNQAQVGSMVAEVAGYGPAVNDGAQSQVNRQGSLTIASVDVVL